MTPIPCLACNHQVNSGDLFETAQALDASLATGHYSKVLDYMVTVPLPGPADKARDQTYYLFGRHKSLIATHHAIRRIGQTFGSCLSAKSRYARLFKARQPRNFALSLRGPRWSWSALVARCHRVI